MVKKVAALPNAARVPLGQEASEGTQVPCETGLLRSPLSLDGALGEIGITMVLTASKFEIHRSLHYIYCYIAS